MRVLGRIASWTLPVVALAAAALVLLPSLLGYQRYVIKTGSMTGTIDRGSLIFDKVVPAKSLKVGDIITYTPPASSGVNEPITHRIVWAGRDRLGHLAFHTKGDFNPVADPWKFVLERPTQARLPHPVCRLRPGRTHRPPSAPADHRAAGAADRARGAGEAVAGRWRGPAP
jgi:signal peptidase I